MSSSDKWAVEATLERTRKRIRCDEGNLAPIPIAIALEADETGEWQWTVDIMLRDDDREIDATASHPVLGTALKNAYLRWCRSHTSSFCEEE